MWCHAIHWANKEGIAIKKLILWGAWTISKYHSVACISIGTTLGATGNMGMDTRLSCGDRGRNGFLAEVMPKLTETS